MARNEKPQSSILFTLFSFLPLSRSSHTSVDKNNSLCKLDREKFLHISKQTFTEVQATLIIKPFPYLLFIPLLILTIQKDRGGGPKDRCMLLGATEDALCLSMFNLYQIPLTGWGLYSLIMCSCQNSTAESHYFKFYLTRHLLFYLAIFFILSYPKPIIDCDSHKSLCCFPQEEIYRTEGRSGKNINQCWIILRSFLFLSFSIFPKRTSTHAELKHSHLSHEGYIFIIHLCATYIEFLLWVMYFSRPWG